MPHQCLSCDKIYEDTSQAILKGCPECDCKLFLFMKKLPSEKKQKELTKTQKEIILKEVENIGNVTELEAPIILKLENIKIINSGKYEIDINQLMKKEKPVIYKVQEGTYVIDLDFLQKNKNGK